jgi:SAM-dependent methyltransferase
MDRFMSEVRLAPGSSSASDLWAYARQRNESSRSAEEIERSFEHSARFYRSLLGSRLPRDKSALVLDLPCGEGALLYALRLMGYQNLLGYDLDANRLATGRKLGLPLHQGDVFEVIESQADGSVGAVLAVDFIEHIEKGDVIRFLALAHRKLSRGGMLLVRTPCADSPQGPTHIFNDFTHKWAASSGVLQWLLEAAGFEGVRVIGEHPKLEMSMGWLRRPLFVAATAIANVYLRMLGLEPHRIWSGNMWGIGQKA